MLNKVILIGRLTDDPELKYTPNGVAVANFSLAVERPYTNQEGETDVDFIDIVVWRKQAENCANHLGKGRLVAVEGRLQIRSYETEEGQRRRVSEIVANNVRFLDWPGDEPGNNQNSNQNANQNNNQGGQNTQQNDDIDVPF